MMFKYVHSKSRLRNSKNETQDPGKKKGILRGFPIILHRPSNPRFMLCHQTFSTSVGGSQFHFVNFLSVRFRNSRSWWRSDYQLLRGEKSITRRCFPVPSSDFRSITQHTNLDQIFAPRFCTKVHGKKIIVEMIQQRQLGWAWCSLHYTKMPRTFLHKLSNNRPMRDLLFAQRLSQHSKQPRRVNGTKFLVWNVFSHTNWSSFACIVFFFPQFRQMMSA